MPAPLAIPVTVTGVPPIDTVTALVLGTVSVVMMARAAPAQPSSARASKARGSASVMRATGRGSPMTPVENGRTASVAQPPCRASARHVASASRMPGAPVPALAFPELTSRKRGGVSARCSRAKVTRAAGSRFRVKHRRAGGTVGNSHDREVVAVQPAHPRTGAAPANAGDGERRRHALHVRYASRPWHCLYFFPEPQGQGELRPILSPRT
jgi:hypothetical protein